VEIFTLQVIPTLINHKNIIKYCDRPFKTVDEMNSTLIHNWNAVVEPEDTVYFLGDFALGPKEAFRRMASALNGHKHFIIGNHDHISKQAIVEAGFESAQYTLTLPDLGLVLTHHPTKVEKGYINVYGHVHDKLLSEPLGCPSVCVCVERINYMPIQYEELMQRIER